MPKEYRTIQEVAGPLMLVRGVEDVAFDELGEIELADGETRRCRVLEIDGSNALVQLFESSTGINLSNSKVRFLGRSMELGVSGDMLGRVFNGMGKPIDGSSGFGIRKFRVEDLPSLEALKAQGVTLLEECIQQHPDLAAICPTSVNTLRIATLMGDKKQGIVYAFIRIGAGAVVDNVDQGGMAAPIDIDTGVIRTVGANKNGDRFEYHPITGTRIPGTKIPYWEEAKAMCLKAAQVVPQLRFIAWDVAVTPDGPVFIEGNSFPSHAIPQFAAHFPDGIGILPRFEAFIDL